MPCSARGDAHGPGWGALVHENREDHNSKLGASWPLRLLARSCLPLPPVARINLLPGCAQSHRLSREACACARCPLVPGLMHAPEPSARFAPCVPVGPPAGWTPPCPLVSGLTVAPCHRMLCFGGCRSSPVPHRCGHRGGERCLPALPGAALGNWKPCWEQRLQQEKLLM